MMEGSDGWQASYDKSQMLGEGRGQARVRACVKHQAIVTTSIGGWQMLNDRQSQASKNGRHQRTKA